MDVLVAHSGAVRSRDAREGAIVGRRPSYRFVQRPRHVFAVGGSGGGSGGGHVLGLNLYISGSSAAIDLTRRRLM